MYRKTSDEKIAAIVTLARRGLSTRQIAAAVGVGTMTVHAHITRAGLNRPDLQGGRRTVTDDDRAHMIALVKYGRSYRSVARRFDVSHQTVRNSVAKFDRRDMPLFDDLDRFELQHGDEGPRHSTVRGYIAHQYVDERPCRACRFAALVDQRLIEYRRPAAKATSRPPRNSELDRRAYLPTHPN